MDPRLQTALRLMAALGSGLAPAMTARLALAQGAYGQGSGPTPHALAHAQPADAQTTDARPAHARPAHARPARAQLGLQRVAAKAGLSWPPTSDLIRRMTAPGGKVVTPLQSRDGP